VPGRPRRRARSEIARQLWRRIVFNFSITKLMGLPSHELDDFAPAFEHAQMEAARNQVVALIF